MESSYESILFVTRECHVYRVSFPPRSDFVVLRPSAPDPTEGLGRGLPSCRLGGHVRPTPSSPSDSLDKFGRDGADERRIEARRCGLDG